MSAIFWGTPAFFQILLQTRDFPNFDPWATQRFPLGHPDFSTGPPKLFLGPPKHRLRLLGFQLSLLAILFWPFSRKLMGRKALHKARNATTSVVADLTLDAATFLPSRGF
jgi:hypothetical protein